MGRRMGSLLPRRSAFGSTNTASTRRPTAKNRPRATGKPLFKSPAKVDPLTQRKALLEARERAKSSGRAPKNNSSRGSAGRRPHQNGHPPARSNKSAFGPSFHPGSGGRTDHPSTSSPPNRAHAPQRSPPNQVRHGDTAGTMHGSHQSNDHTIEMPSHNRHQHGGTLSGGNRPTRDRLSPAIDHVGHHPALLAEGHRGHDGHLRNDDRSMQGGSRSGRDGHRGSTFATEDDHRSHHVTPPHQAAHYVTPDLPDVLLHPRIGATSNAGRGSHNGSSVGETHHNDHGRLVASSGRGDLHDGRDHRPGVATSPRIVAGTGQTQHTDDHSQSAMRSGRLDPRGQPNDEQHAQTDAGPPHTSKTGQGTQEHDGMNNRLDPGSHAQTPNPASRLQDIRDHLDKLPPEATSHGKDGKPQLNTAMPTSPVQGPLENVKHPKEQKFRAGVNKIAKAIVAYGRDKAQEQNQEDIQEYVALLISQHLPSAEPEPEPISGPTVDQMPQLIRLAEDELDAEEAEAKADAILQRHDPQGFKAKKANDAHKARVKERMELMQKQEAQRAPSSLQSQQKLQEIEGKGKTDGWVAVLKAERLAYFAFDYPNLTGHKPSRQTKIPHNTSHDINTPVTVAASPQQNHRRQPQPHYDRAIQQSQVGAPALHNRTASLHNGISAYHEPSEWDEEEQVQGIADSTYSRVPVFADDSTDIPIRGRRPVSQSIRADAQDNTSMLLGAPISAQHKSSRSRTRSPALLSPQSSWQFCAEANRA